MIIIQGLLAIILAIIATVIILFITDVVYVTFRAFNFSSGNATLITILVFAMIAFLSTVFLKLMR